jgi:hypothetical protein
MKLFNSCISVCSQSQDQNKRSSLIGSGLVSKNGIVFFPEEFLSRPKRKSEKQDVKKKVEEINNEGGNLQMENGQTLG